MTFNIIITTLYIFYAFESWLWTQQYLVKTQSVLEKRQKRNRSIERDKYNRLVWIVFFEGSMPVSKKKMLGIKMDENLLQLRLLPRREYQKGKRERWRINCVVVGNSPSKALDIQAKIKCCLLCVRAHV